MEDKPRIDLGQAEDKKDLRRAATEGKCNFTQILTSESSTISAGEGNQSVKTMKAK